MGRENGGTARGQAERLLASCRSVSSNRVLNALAYLSLSMTESDARLKLPNGVIRRDDRNWILCWAATEELKKQ